MPSRRSPFAESLRQWRAARRFSQLELALRTGTPPRHVSFLETGRARPTESMVHRLADALEVPLAERNALWRAAGFADAYPERQLDDAAMAGIRFVIDRLLQSHAPWPALVLDSAYDIVQANATAQRLLFGAAQAPVERPNLVTLVLGPMRPLLENWDEVVVELRTRLRHEAAQAGADPRLKPLLAQTEAAIPASVKPAESAGESPVMLTRLRTPLGVLRTISTFVRFGGVRDVTVDGLHVELIYPADDAADALLRTIAGTAS